MLKRDLTTVAMSQAAIMRSMDKGVPREIAGHVNLHETHANIITGPRRCGKSTLLRQLADQLDQFHYFNFEDVRVSSFTVDDFVVLDEILVEMNGPQDVYFFDEIQNIPGWEMFVRTKLDAGFHVTITGSNATMMSKDLGTKLTGRHLRHELSPFSYNEMLAFTRARAGPASFGEYLTRGGFPEFLQSGRMEMLQHLFTDIVHRDILVRYNIRNDKQYIALATYLLTNAGKEFSFTRLKNSFSLGSTNTAIDHVSYLEDAYLISVVPRLEHSYAKQLVAPKKVYACDTGLARAISASYTKDEGRVLENAVFTHLKRRGDEIYHHKGTGECDFVTRARGVFTGAVQACTAITRDTRAREFQGMVDALRATGLERGTIVTLEDDDEISLEGKHLRLVPAWRWMAGMT